PAAPRRVVTGRHYYGSCPEWVERAVAGAPADLYLLLHPDVPWEPDPQRDRGHRREEMHALFRDALVARRSPLVDVCGGWDERRGEAERPPGGALPGGRAPPPCRPPPNPPPPPPAPPRPP